MGATLKALRELQRVELRLNALRAKIGAKKRSVLAFEKKAQALSEAIADKHEESLLQQAAIAQLELEIRSHDEEINKLRQALNQSKSNKEYAALLTQINTDKADNSKLEDRVLEMINGVEVLKKQEQELVDKQARAHRDLERASKAADAVESENVDHLRKLESQRQDAGAKVPVDILEAFNRMADRNEGEALAVVIQPNPKRQEFICDGCNMSVTLEQYSALQTQDKLQYCNNCGRLMMLEIDGE